MSIESNELTMVSGSPDMNVTLPPTRGEPVD